jgi:hypothetical protein
VRVALVLLAIGALVLLLQVAGTPRDTRVWNVLYDFGHAPLFGLVALLFLELFRLRGPTMRATVASYLLAFAAAVGLGALVEAAQIASPRDADPLDAVRNAVGAAAFLAFRASLGHRRGGFDVPPRPARLALRLGAVLLLAVQLLPVVRVVWAYRERSRALPTLAALDADWSHQFLDIAYATLTLVDPPRDWPAGDRPARLLLSRGAPHPRFEIEEPYPDWSGYRAFRFEVYSINPGPVDLTLRIHDELHRKVETDRFNRPLRILPGMNRIEVSLDDVRNAPLGRTMDMRRIRSVILFATRPPEPIEVTIGNFRLVP